MSGGGRRGRRGGRRQRRREEQARQQAAQQTNGQSGPGHPVLPASARAPTANSQAPHVPEVQSAAPQARAQEAPTQDRTETHTDATRAHVDPAHPRPMSARELVARLEAMRAHEAASALEEASHDASAPAHLPAAPAALPAPAPVPKPVEPRRFLARGREWLAQVAGRGSGGTGRVAPARLEAIRFSSAAEPEQIAAEVIVPHANLDDLYDDELAELLERGLRTRTRND